MSAHVATIRWSRGGRAFAEHRYSRAHVWRFDGGAELRASSLPHVVPVPMSDASAVDPEEAFVASLASGLMPRFPNLAVRAGLVVDAYEDAAEGVMAKDADGWLAMTAVTPRPKATFSGAKRHAPAEVETLHRRAHARCFIAASVKTGVRCEPVLA